MTQWHFVIAAYILVIAATVAMLLVAWRAMRRAEADAAAVLRR